MKTLRLVGMALLAVLLSVNFTACSSDDDEPGNENQGSEETITTKKLTYISSPDDVLKVCLENVKYDDKGRVISYKGDLIDIYYADEYTIKYGEGTISVIDEGDEDYSYYYVVSNGLITKASDSSGSYEFEYDNNKRFVKVVRTYNDSDRVRTFDFVWENNNLVKITDSNNERKIECTYKYTNKEAKILAFGSYIDFEPVINPFLLLQGYFGNSISKNLIEQEVENAFGDVDVCNYTYDIENGYVSHFKRDNDNYYLTWE